MSGSLLSDSDEAPRTRMRAPVPTCPELPTTLTPAARPVSRSWTLRTGCVATTAAAATVLTALPTARRSAAPAVPVTTTWLSSSTRSARATCTSSPARALTVRGW
jgi:hypothetical protein